MQSRFSHYGHKGFNTMRTLFACIFAFVAFAPLATAGDFIDTRLSFVFSDDNLLSDPGESLINSPEIDFGARGGVFYPFENLNSQDEGDETLTHLVLYKEMPSFIDNLITDAAFVARLGVLTEPQNGFNAGDIRLNDAGSYLRARYSFSDVQIDPKTGHTKNSPRQLEFTFFPTNADRFRAGYTYDLSWAGNKIYTQQKSQFATPGFRFKFDWDGFYLFAGYRLFHKQLAVVFKGGIYAAFELFARARLGYAHRRPRVGGFDEHGIPEPALAFFGERRSVEPRHVPRHGERSGLYAFGFTKRLGGDFVHTHRGRIHTAALHARNDSS